MKSEEKNTGERKVDISMDESAVIEMITFTTNEMISISRNYFRGWNLQKSTDIIIYRSLAKDNLGHSMAMFYEFVRSETADIMQEALPSFCRMMENDVNQTKL